MTAHLSNRSVTGLLPVKCTHEGEVTFTVSEEVAALSRHFTAGESITMSAFDVFVDFDTAGPPRAKAMCSACGKSWSGDLA